MAATLPNCFCLASPRSRRRRRKRRARYLAIQPGNRLASDSTARSQSRAGHMVSSENLCSPRELSRSRSRRRHSNETIRWRKACPVRRRRSDIPSLCGENPTCRQTWCLRSPDRSPRRCNRSKVSLPSELVSTFCRHRSSCRDRDPMNRSRARPARPQK